MRRLLGLLATAILLAGCSTRPPAATPAAPFNGSVPLIPLVRVRTSDLGFQADVLGEGDPPVVWHGRDLKVKPVSGCRIVTWATWVTNPSDSTSTARVTLDHPVLIGSRGHRYSEETSTVWTSGVLRDGRVASGGHVEVFQVFQVPLSDLDLVGLWTPLGSAGPSYSVRSGQQPPPTPEGDDGPAG